MNDDTTLLEQFRAAAAAGSVSEATIPGVSAVLAPLAVTALALADGRAEPAGDDVVLTGSTTFSNGVGWNLTLTGNAAGAATAFALQLRAARPGWTFGAAFPALPQSRYAPSYGNAVVLTDSIIAPLVVDGAAIALSSADPQPRLSGWLLLAGSQLAQYEYFIGGGSAAPRLWCSGELTFVDRPAGNPLVRVDAAAPAIDLGIAFLTDITVDQTGMRLANDVIDWMTLGDDPPPRSAAEIYARISVGRVTPIVGTVTAPLLQGDFIWPFRVWFGNPPPPLREGVAAIVSLFTGTSASDLAIPAGLAPLDAFGVSEIELGLIPVASSFVPDLDSVGITLVSTTAWNPPVPFVEITQVGTRWVYRPGSASVAVTGSVWGLLTLGSSDSPVVQRDGTPVRLLVNVDLPFLDISASTQGPIDLSLTDAFGAYFQGPKPGVPATLTVEQIEIQASLPRKTYSGYLRVTGNWSIPIGNVNFSLDEMFFEMMVTPNAVAGSVTGILSLAITGRAPATLNVSARYPGDGSWTFSGGLVNGDLDVIAFVVAFWGADPPADLPSLAITDLWATYSTATGNPFAVAATVVARWNPELLGLTLSLTASVALRRELPTTTAQRALAPSAPADGAMVYAGSISGTFEVNRLAITAGLSFFDAETTYLLRVTYDGVGLEAATAYVTTKGNRHQVVTFRLIGLTLGTIVEYLASLANPNANYQLAPPWTFLNAIDLSAVTVTVDPTDQTIALDYAIALALPFVRVDTVGLVYDRSTGEPAVRFTITGEFLGASYTKAEPLTWDALNDAPPAVPGKGNQLVDLRYLGFGQHVTLTGLTDFESVSDVLRALREEMQPVANPDQNPLSQPSGAALRFDENSRWMIGADFTLMGTVSLGLVLHDPDLYGIVIALAGDDAGSLAGLSFELLYKKVSDDVGVFHVRLQVPDAFRQLQFGAVSITLGIITVDVFTNGNFLIDLGFPHGRDYDLSFGLQAGIFIGRGGIYFGVLNGTTSRRVPRITNGTFDPVLELGIGLAVGVGRTFEKGPLKAGLYVELEVIFEGVLGWFHPTDAGAPTALYYWCRGTAAIVGKLYGSVDFKVIRVAVSVEAHAAVTVTMAAYEATLIELDVGVEVNAEVTILFISVSFSFSLQLRADFTIGASSTPPWILAGGDSGRGQARLGRAVHAPRRRRAHDVVRLTGPAHRRAALAAGADPCAAYTLVWNPAATVFPGGATPQANLLLAPFLTVANVPVSWSGTAPANDAPADDAPANDAPAYRIAFALFAEGAAPPGAESIRATHRQTAAHSTAADDPGGVAFNLLIEAMTRWSLDALGIDPLAGTVTFGELDDLAAQLDCPQTESGGFTFANLAGFLSGNLRLTIAAAPAGGAVQPGVAFPMIPLLAWTSPDLPPPADARDFTAYQPVDATYEAEVAAYFAKLDPGAPSGSRAPSGSGTASDSGTPTGDASATAGAALDDAAESMATFVFRDYFLLIAKSAVQAALSLLARFPQAVALTDSLRTIAGGFTTVRAPYTVNAGDTVDQVASHFGYAAAELTALDPTLSTTLANTPPGGTIAVTLGVTPESIAAANPGWPLVAAQTVPLGALDVQVAQAETLAVLATRLGMDASAWLATPALLATPNLLRGGAPITLTGFTYANTGALALPLVAALFFVRLGYAGPPLGVALADWYAQAIVQLNGTTIGADGTLPAQLTVPAQANALAPTVTWTTLPGDTLESVAATFALAQNTVAGSTFAAYLAEVVRLNPSSGATVTLPDGTVAVAAFETLGTFARRLLLDLTVPAQATAFRALVATADVLTPLAVVGAPAVVATTAAGQTLLGLAQAYGLALEDLGARIAPLTGLLAASTADTVLFVPNVPTIGVNALVAQLVTGAPAATVAGQVSRFLLYGLRVPAPVLGNDGRYHATGPMTGLYELIGQQVTGPAPDAALPPATVRARIVVSASPSVPWIVFADAAVSGADEGPELLAARHPQLDALNPALRLPGRLRPGLVLRTAVADTVTVDVTESELESNYPATALVPNLIGGLRAMQLYRDTPVRHGLAQTIPWQAADGVALPQAAGQAALAGTPSLWPFPADLLAQAALDAATPFVLKQVDPQAGPAVAPVEVGAYAWATALPFALRRIAGRPTTYELFGADPAGRQLLLEALTYLAAPPAPDTGTLRLLYALSPGAGMPPGVSSDALDLTRTYAVKANLSTETRSGPALRARGVNDPVYAAPLSDAAGFATLLWECSVVGGGGYWLEYTTAAGAGLPDAIFAADGTASLTLVLQLASQTTWNPPALPQRRLRTFSNAAVVGAGIDPSSAALFAEAADLAETVRTATVAPGEVGFALDLVKPPAGPAVNAQDALRARYGLIGYELVATPPFAASRESMPVGPQTKPPASGFDGPSDEQVWQLAQVVPIHAFAPSAVAPVDGLPDPAADPYAGINGAGTPANPVLAHTAVQLWFHDLLGNASAPPAAEDTTGRIAVDVGYTDPVIGVASWPATTLGYTVAAAAPGATLAVTVAAQSAGFVPGFADLGGALAAQAAEQRERFARIYFQVMQPDVSAALFTTLESDPGPVLRDLPAISVDPLRAYAAAAYAWLGTLAQLTTVPVDAAVAATLDAAVAHYGLDYDALGNANAARTLGQLVSATTIAVPRSVPFADGFTVAQLCAPLDPVTVLSDQDNVALPLRTGIELAIPATSAAVPSATIALTDLAASLNCTIATLVAANAARPSLLRPGFVFVCQGVEVMVGLEPPYSDATLDGVASAFVANGVPFDAVMVASANAELPGMFRAGAALLVDGYVAKAGETLQTNGSGAALAALVAANVGTTNLFFGGAPLFLTTVPDAAQMGATLADAARTYAVSPGDLLRHNGGLAPGAALAVPGHAALPAPLASARVPYRIRPGDTLAGIAALFAGADGSNPALALESANANAPGTVAAAVRIDIGTQHVTTQAASSFAQVLALFDPPVSPQDLVAAIGTTPGVLAAGALLLCPLAQLPAAVAPQTALTPDAAAARYGVTPAQLLTANAATGALLAPGVALAPLPGTTTPALTTAADDSLVSLMRRFALLGVATTPAELAAANHDVPCLRPRAALLLAPPDATVSTTIGAQGGWHFPAATFPIHVLLQLARVRELVAPDFRGPLDAPWPAVRDRAAVPARRAPGATGDGLTLDAFATALQAAVPGLRVATGRVLAEEREVGGTDVWAVLFTAGFVESVTVRPPLTVPGVAGPQPRSYALRPLSTSLVARDGVTIQTFDPSTGGLTGGTLQNFQGVDLEMWARAFLTDVELFGSAQYAAPAYRANAAALDLALAAKQRLAPAVARGLDQVLDLAAATPSAAALASARAALAQRLLADVAAGYATAAVFQYDAAVTSPWAADTARLAGTAQLQGGVGGPQRSAGVTGAKTSLANGTSYVNFALALAEPGRERNVPLMLSYAIGELEFDVTPVDGYAASNWLSFVQPLAQNPPAALHVDLGAPVLPVPLRAYPPLPALTQQSAESADAATLDGALHWTYAFTYAHQSAAQDQPHLQVEFNLPPSNGLRAAADVEDDLFAALAQYAAVSGDLWSALAALPDLPNAVPANVANAVQTFAALAGRVADRWATYWPDTATALAPGPTGDLYEFAVTLDTTPDDLWYDTLTLARVDGDAIAWPAIACTTSDGATYVLEPLAQSANAADANANANAADTADVADTAVQAYRFPARTVAAFAQLAFTYRFAGLHVADYQNAIARVWVVRNEQLLGPTAPATRSPFVYRTPALAFPQPVVPLLETDQRIEIGPWSSDPAANPLIPVFAAIFDGDPADRLVSVGVSYGYDLVPPTNTTPPIETYLPVGLHPKFTYQTSTPQDVADVANAWFAAAAPAVAGGKWAFAIGMYSALDPNLERPILRLTRLISSLEAPPT